MRRLFDKSGTGIDLCSESSLWHSRQDSDGDVDTELPPFEGQSVAAVDLVKGSKEGSSLAEVFAELAQDIVKRFLKDPGSPFQTLLPR